MITSQNSKDDHEIMIDPENDVNQDKHGLSGLDGPQHGYHDDPLTDAGHATDKNISPLVQNIVLRLTSCNGKTIIQSRAYHVSRDGATFGRDDASSIRVEIDLDMAPNAHARIAYEHGIFYLLARDENATYVRLRPKSTVDDHESDSRMRHWPLLPRACFALGSSEFQVSDARRSSSTDALVLECTEGKLLGKRYVLNPTLRTQWSIGRSTECSIHTSDSELSRVHAVICHDVLRNEFVLKDNHSTNGSYMKLTGPYARAYRLALGDQIVLSRSCFLVHR